MELLASFIFGLCIGSFLNVCIYRIPKGESVVYPPSHCPSCGKRIKWYDNVPLLSYLILRGKCRECGERISPVYPFVELLAGILTSLTVWKFGVGLESLKYLILFYYLIVVSFIDLKFKEVPIRLSYLALITGFILSGISGIESLKSSVIGASLGAGLVLFVNETYLFFKGEEGLGSGDANVMAVIGAFLGKDSVLPVFFLSPFFGLLGLFFIRKREIPYVPFISLGAVSFVFFRDFFKIFSL